MTSRLAPMLGMTLVLALALTAQADVTLVATADTEGHVTPCKNCPNDTGLGGLARRGTLLGTMRGGGPILLLDAGNVLFGDDSVASAGKVMVAGYEAVGYDAINISYRDFRMGKAATIALMKDAKFSAVSANLLDAESGAPLFAPFVVKEIGGTKVAVIGVCEPPAGMQFLPHLKEQLAGVRIQPPAEALAAVLPKAKAEAQRVVLLYYGTSEALRAIRTKFGGDLAVTLVGGTRPAALPTDAPLVVGTAEHGKSLAVVTVDDAGKAHAAAVKVEPDVPADPKVNDAIAPHFKRLDASAILTDGPAIPAVATIGVPSPAELGKTYPLDITAANRAVRLTIQSAAVLDRFGQTAAAPGRRLLVLSTEWQNVIQPAPPKAGRPSDTPVSYKMSDFAQGLYVVIDGCRLARLHADAGKMPTHVPLRDFTLAKIGDRIRGALVFDVPDAPTKSLELRAYDFAHGHVTAALQTPAGGLTQPEPIEKPVRNAVLEVGVYGVQREKRIGDQTAPQGMTFVIADVRARSLFGVRVDATAFDPAAKAGANIQVGTFADWADAHRYLRLVADGEYDYPLLPALSGLAPTPRLLPDVMTGERAVFLAPEAAKTLELAFGFPNAREPTGHIISPRSLSIRLEGKVAQVEKPKTAVVMIDDDMFRVMVVDQRIAGDFAGHQPAEGRRFLVLDMTVQNTGDTAGEFFQTKKQLVYNDEAGRKVPIHPATYAGVHYPADLVWVPAKEQRSFEVAFEIPATDTKPRLGYAGFTLAKLLDLQPIPAGAVAVGPQPNPGATTTRPAVAGTTRPAIAGTTRPSGVGTTRPAFVQVPGKAALPRRVPAAQLHEPRGIEGVGLTVERVNAAIDRGGAALWELKAEELLAKHDGKKFGFDAQDMLILLALVHAEVHTKEPACDGVVRAALGGTAVQTLSMYGAGLYLMLAESYGDATFLPRCRDAVRAILEAQGPQGTWTYTTFRDPAFFKSADTESQEVVQVHGGRPLEGPGSLDEPMKRETAWEQGRDGDNSCSQYAILGLYAAARMGIAVPAETWERCEKAMRARQMKDGGWAYESSGASYGSMTAAGVAALTICRHLQGEKPAAVDEAIEKGVGWLDENFSVRENPELRDTWVFYWLYGLERVGRILDTEFIGDHEWYPYGARFLISSQRTDGAWIGKQGEEKQPHIATSFALLFLTRATPSLEVAPKKGPGTLRTIMAKPPINRVYVILDCSGSMLPEVNGRQKFDHARDAVMALVSDLPENSEVALRVYGHRKRGIEEGASEDTELLIRMGKLDKEQFMATVAPLRARGRTPLALSLSEAAKDLAKARGRKGEQVTLVLLTDGGEDTQPRQDPVAAAAQIGALAHVSFQIVGFDINRDDWTRELAAMAKSGRGQYLPAAQTETLLAQLRQAVYRVPDGYVLADDRGRVVHRGPFGDMVEKLEPGKYVLSTSLAGLSFKRDLWINPQTTTTARFDPARIDWSKAADTAAPTPKAAFCTHCGKQLTAGAKFCIHCGTKVP